MKKVRILKEMPFAKVGTVWEDHSGGISIDICTIEYPIRNIHWLVKDGWLEWVEEEKTLEEKIKLVTWRYYPKEEDDARQWSRDAAQIAKEHYLGVFDKANLSRDLMTEECRGCFECNRKALEEA